MTERSARERDHHLNKQVVADAEELRTENAFLSGVVSRFEKKTMSLERQLEVLSEIKMEAETKEKETLACREELQAARSMFEEQLERQHLAAARSSELEQANAEAAERLEEQRQAAESVALTLRDFKKDRNQKMQDLFRRCQGLEQQKRELEAAKQTLTAAVEAGDSSAQTTRGASSSDEGARTSSEELTELRLLNEQLIERLGTERTEHGQSKQSLAAALEAGEKENEHHARTMIDLGGVSRENETLSIRLEQLVDQLFDLATRNDTLQQELAEAEGERPRAEHRSELTASRLDAEILEEDCLHSMS